MDSLFELAQQLAVSEGNALWLETGQPCQVVFADGRREPALGGLPDEQILQLLGQAGQRIFLGVAEFRVHQVAPRGVKLVPILPAPQPRALGIPAEALEPWLQRPGLTLMAGPAMAWAAMIDALNALTRNHIVILEEPMEWFHFHKQCMVTQREQGPDFQDWEAALASSALTGCQVLALRPPWQRRPLATVLERARNDVHTLLLCPDLATERVIPELLALFPPEQRPFFALRLSVSLSFLFHFQPGRMDRLESGLGLRTGIREMKFDQRFQPQKSWVIG